MDNYKLEKEDFVIYERLVRVTKSIYSLYNKLYELEVDGKKDTEEYKKVLEYLNLSIEVEKNIYKEFNNYYKTVGLIEYIMNDLPENHNFYIESIINRDVDKNIVQRILITLINRAYTEEDSICETFIDYIEYYGDLICGDLDKLLDKDAKNTLYLYKLIEKDYFNIFLYFLNNVISGLKKNTLTNALVKAKYDLSFLNKSIENDLINIDFNLPESIITNSKYISNEIKYNLKDYNYMKNVIGKYKSDYNIHELLKANDSDYNKEEYCKSNLIRQIFLTSSLVLVSKRCLENINIEFSEAIESSEYLKYHLNDTLSQKYIMELIEKVFIRKNNLEKKLKYNGE